MAPPAVASQPAGQPAGSEPSVPSLSSLASEAVEELPSVKLYKRLHPPTHKLIAITKNMNQHLTSLLVSSKKIVQKSKNQNYLLFHRKSSRIGMRSVSGCEKSYHGRKIKFIPSCLSLQYERAACRSLVRLRDRLRLSLWKRTRDLKRRRKIMKAKMMEVFETISFSLMIFGLVEN